MRRMLLCGDGGRACVTAVDLLSAMGKDNVCNSVGGHGQWHRVSANVREGGRARWLRTWPRHPQPEGGQEGRY